MNFVVDTTKGFEREAKRLFKRYASLAEDIAELISGLEDQPHQGTPIGRGCYKVRLAIRSKGKGKSGGARVITVWWPYAKRSICCPSTTSRNRRA